MPVLLLPFLLMLPPVSSSLRLVLSSITGTSSALGGQVVLDRNDKAPESAYRPEDVSGITGWIGAVSCAVLLSS